MRDRRLSGSANVQRGDDDQVSLPAVGAWVAGIEGCCYWHGCCQSSCHASRPSLPATAAMTRRRSFVGPPPAEPGVQAEAEEGGARGEGAERGRGGVSQQGGDV